MKYTNLKFAIYQVWTGIYTCVMQKPSVCKTFPSPQAISSCPCPVDLCRNSQRQLLLRSFSQVKWDRLACSRKSSKRNHTVYTLLHLNSTLSIMLLRFIHVVYHGLWISCWWTPRVFPVWAVMNKAAKNILVQIFLDMYCHISWVST